MIIPTQHTKILEIIWKISIYYIYIRPIFVFEYMHWRSQEKGSQRFINVENIYYDDSNESVGKLKALTGLSQLLLLNMTGNLKMSWKWPSPIRKQYRLWYAENNSNYAQEIHNGTKQITAEVKITLELLNSIQSNKFEIKYSIRLWDMTTSLQSCNKWAKYENRQQMKQYHFGENI